MRLSSVIGIFLVVSHLALAQYDAIEKDYYTFPIQPEQSNFLSGNMGELRSSHFHAGLDIKTKGKVGLNVFAAADGYVSRVAVSPGGYGNAIYVQHPNGTTTVYAHLKSFSDEIAQYVLENQYKRKSFRVNLFPKRGQFPVKKGEVIALSGNSGSSTGPHLHFEIRGANQEVLDPLRIGFAEIVDNIPPVANRVAMKTMHIDSRINNQFGRFEFPLTIKNNVFSPPDTLYAIGKIGLELYAYDQHNGAPNKNGVPKLEMTVDGSIHFEQNIDSIQFSKQRNILVHTNYKVQRETRRRFNKLYVDDGNDLKFYDKRIDNGFISISQNEIKTITIKLEDAYGNTSNTQLVIKGDSGSFSPSYKTPKKKLNVIDNTLIITRSIEGHSPKATLYNTEGSLIIEPAYETQTDYVYLIDLRKFLPLSIDAGDGTKELLSFADRVPAASNHSFLAETYALQFSKNTLFDTVYVRAQHYINEEEQEILEVSDDFYPLKAAFKAEFKPLVKYDSIEQYAVYNVSNPKYPGYLGGEFEEGVFKFQSRSFGEFTLLRDTTQPSIKQIARKDDIISFRIKDDLSGINNFEAKLNGEWLLMNYDPKRNYIWSERLDKNKPLSGEFELKVSDNAGNESNFTLKIN